MIKKVMKTCSNPYGVINTLVDFRKPIIVGFFPEDHNYRELNGYLNKIMYLLQIRHNEKTNSNYDILNIPFDIIAYERDDHESLTKLLENVPENNLQGAKDMFRNINIVSYCHGHNKTRRFLDNIYNTLVRKHYNKNEIEEIMQNIFVLEIVHNLRIEKRLCRFPYVTSVIFHNIDDDENLKYKDFKINDNYPVILQDNPQKKNSRLFLYKSFGEGSLADKYREHDFTKDYIYAPILNAYMSIVLIKTMKSSLNHTQLDIEKLIDSLSLIPKLVEEYQKENPKAFCEYTKDDLNKLNAFIMNKVQHYCQEELDLNLLTQKEKDMLNQKDISIKQYTKLGINSKIENILWGIQNTIDMITKYSNQYDKNEEIIFPIGNIPMPQKVSDIILDKIDELLNRIHEFFTFIDEVKLSEDFSIEIRHEYNEYINSILILLKAKLRNPNLMKIIDEYNITDEVFKL